MVMQAQVQPEVTANLIAQYSSEIDSLTHDSKYSSYMISLGPTDATQCHLFPITLGDQAYKWFKSLVPISLESFHQLGQLFLSYFVTLALRPTIK